MNPGSDSLSVPKPYTTHDPAEAARLGDAIYLITESGLRAMAVPEIAAIRPVDAPETLRAQTALLAELRGTQH